MVNVLNSAIAYVYLNIWKKCFCKRKGRSRARTMYTHSRMRRNTMFQNCVKSTSHAVAGTWTDMCGWAFIAHSSHMRRRRTYLCMRGFLDMGTKFRIQESLPPLSDLVREFHKMVPAFISLQGWFRLWRAPGSHCRGRQTSCGIGRKITGENRCLSLRMSTTLLSKKCIFIRTIWI